VDASRSMMEGGGGELIQPLPTGTVTDVTIGLYSVCSGGDIPSE